jgi:hypothetical protein
MRLALRQTAASQGLDAADESARQAGQDGYSGTQRPPLTVIMTRER